MRTGEKEPAALRIVPSKALATSFDSTDFETNAAIDGWREKFGVEGCIVNAYLLYKDRELRRRFEETELTLAELLGYDGLLYDGFGSVPGIHRRLYLDNRKILAFQDSIGADVISPLDLVTPPGDSRRRATWKLERTLERIREAKETTRHAILAGVQQGGRFPDLRRCSLEAVLEIGVDYLALGSLVPFFNRGHDLGFVGRVIREARELAGEGMPIHVYGAGDPVELPFFFALGANVFDSASYGHYANGGWYMTPYGALRGDQLDELAEQVGCDCPYCAPLDRPSELAGDAGGLASHNLWTILRTIERLRTLGRGPELDEWLEQVLERHQAWFPESRLESSWRALDE